jgi:AsmA protein
VTGQLATEGGGPPVPAGAQTPQQNSAPNAEQKPDEIQKLLNSPKTKVYGAMQRAGWSSEKLNLALLGVADGNAQVNVGKIHFKNVTVGRSAVAIAVKNQAMQASFSDVELYGGHGKGVVMIDGSSGTANLGANVNLQGVSALPFLKDAAKFEWVSGKANVTLQLAANGQSQLQLVENLNGKANFYFADGAIIGFDLPAAINGLSNGDARRRPNSARSAQRSPLPTASRRTRICSS